MMLDKLAHKNKHLYAIIMTKEKLIMKTNRHLIWFLVLHLIINSVYNFGHPVTPQYINNIAAPIYMTGVLFGVMALAQFIFAPLWGQISDIFGRKIAFIGPLGYAIGQLGFVLFSDPTMLLIFRFIAGAFAVITATVHFAYVSDKSSLQNRAKYLGIAALLLPIGVFFGYTIGGFLGDVFSPRLTFLIQAIASFFMAIIMYFFIDSPKRENAKITNIKWNVIKEDLALLQRNRDTALKYILLITFLTIISYQLIISQAAVILTNGFNKTTTYVGLFIAIYNLLAGITTFFIQKQILKSKKSNIKYLPYLSLCSIFSSLTAFMIILKIPFIMWLGLMGTTMLNTIFIAQIQDIITKVDKHNEKGALIGLNQAMQSLGMFAGTIGAGLLVAQNIFSPLLLGTCLFILTFIINQFVVKKKLEQHIIQT